MSDILLFRRGRPEFHSDHDHPVFPQAIPIASQLPQAVGVGMARNYRDADHAVVAYLGDGATSEGDFHEAMNFAGVFDAPVVFLCENNAWAISHPVERQTASDSIAVKADAYGFEGRRVDGNDPLAVREVVTEALGAAREGNPVLVESLTYRQGAHTTADDPSVYRDDDPDLPAWRTRDPVERLEAFCLEAGVLDEGDVEAVHDAAAEEVAEATEAAEAVAEADPDDVFDHAYASQPPHLAGQREAMHASIERGHGPEEHE